MKQTAATTSMFKIVLAFTFLFSAFIAVAITYNRVYRVKNQAISIIEKYEGTTTKALGILNSYLSKSGYNEMGKCESGEYGISNLDNPHPEVALNGKDYYYCLSESCSSGLVKCRITNNSNSYIKYKVKMFFKFNLPFLGELANFKITGETKQVKLYDEMQLLGG